MNNVERKVLFSSFGGNGCPGRKVILGMEELRKQERDLDSLSTSLIKGILEKKQSMPSLDTSVLHTVEMLFLTL